MNDIIQNLEANATNGKENFCYISEKQLNAMKELSKREAKENKQIKEIYKELFNTYQKLKKENEEVTSLNLHQADKIQQLQERIEYLERSNNRREDTILEQRQEISDLEDNWIKLKEIAKSQSGFKKRAGLKGRVWFEIDELLDKMQELEGSDNDE